MLFCACLRHDYRPFSDPLYHLIVSVIQCELNSWTGIIGMFTTVFADGSSQSDAVNRNEKSNQRIISLMGAEQTNGNTPLGLRTLPPCGSGRLHRSNKATCDWIDPRWHRLSHWSVLMWWSEEFIRPSISATASSAEPRSDNRASVIVNYSFPITNVSMSLNRNITSAHNYKPDD